MTSDRTNPSPADRPADVRPHRRGRPRLGDNPKVAYFNMRTDPALRARVEASAQAHGKPLVQEIERLVQAALDAEGLA